VNGALIDHNKGKGGDTEDVVSLYRRRTWSSRNNWFEGTNWTSPSGSGIAIGDGGGSNNIARRNKLLNIGQVGIHIAGGTNNRIDSNIIYGAPRSNSNVGMYVWNQSGAPCSGAHGREQPSPLLEGQRRVQPVVERRRLRDVDLQRQQLLDADRSSDRSP
jgi:hypothetical protein